MIPEGCVPLCRACKHRSFSREESERRKTIFLEKTLDFCRLAMEPLRGSDQRWHYRERVCLRAQWIGDRWQLGLWQDETLLPIPDCPLHSPRVNSCLKRLSLILPGHLPLAFVVINGASLCLVLKSKPTNHREWSEKLSLPEVGALWINWNPGAGDRVFFAKGFELVSGPEWLEDEQGFYYHPAVFRQVLPDLHRQALQEAQVFLQERFVVDFYSGNGVSCSKWREFCAVELNGFSVKAARKKFSNVMRGRAEDRLPQVDRIIEDKFGVGVFANPSRLGLEIKVAQWLQDRKQLTHLVYLSCNAKSLARDLGLLTRWQLIKIQPWDFFPQNAHVEVMAFLRRSL